MGAKAVESAPAVWQSFIASNLALCQLIVDELTERMEEANTHQVERDAAEPRGEEEEEEDEVEDDEGEDDPMYEETIGMLSEQIDALEGVKKRKLPFADRMGLIGMLVELSGDQLPLLASIEDSAKAEELQVEGILSAALHSALQYGADCLQRAGGVGKSLNKLQLDSEEEALMCLKLLDTLIGCILNEQPHARRAFLAHAKAVIEWLKGVGLSSARSPAVRQAALSVLSNLIEADPALLSPPPSGSEEVAEASASTEPTSSTAAPSPSSTPQLSPAERSGLLHSLLDAAVALCSSEEQLSVETGHFSSHNLGTALLDVTLSPHTVRGHSTLRRPDLAHVPLPVRCVVPLLECDPILCCGFCGVVSRLACTGCVLCVERLFSRTGAGSAALPRRPPLHCPDVLR